MHGRKIFFLQYSVRKNEGKRTAGIRGSGWKGNIKLTLPLGREGKEWFVWFRIGADVGIL
jgi:hypothetical protein